MRTKIATARATMIAALSLGAGAAHAVPIVFEFTGTVTSRTISSTSGVTADDSLNGQAVSGRIVLETDGLLPPRTTPSPRGTFIAHTDSTLDTLDLITTELSIAGVSYDMGLHPTNSGHILAFDSSGLPPCPGCSPVRDILVLQDTSQHQYWDMPSSVNHRRDVLLSWSDESNPFGFVDLSNGFDPLVWLPVMSTLLPTGQLLDSTGDCADDICTIVEETSTSFSISSLTVSAANVPEPGTLALFAVGLLGVAMGRRRQA